MSIAGQPVGAWLDELGAKSPTPGGGAVAPLVGAIASALGAMTVQYSKGAKGLEANREAHSAALAELARARAMLLELAVEDGVAYQALSTAMALPKDDPQRGEKIPKLAAIAMQVPFNVLATITSILGLLERLAPITNRHLQSDLVVAAIMLEAGARAAREMVRANEPMAPPELARQAAAESDRLVQICGVRLRGTCEALGARS